TPTHFAGIAFYLKVVLVYYRVLTCYSSVIH
ncbi:unnamed protein product, partial [Rotaria magnacalcarata]